MTMWMHPEDAMVSEINQTRRIKTIHDPTYMRRLEPSNPQTEHSCQGLGAGRWCLTGTEFGKTTSPAGGWW